MCRLLLDAGANINARNAYYGRSPLHHFCQGDRHVDVIDMLVRAGLDINIKDADDETPLMNAIIYHHTALAQRLIELGTDLNLVNKSSGNSAILSAVSCEHHAIIPTTIKRGADQKAINRYGRNIVHLAARYAGDKTMSVLAEGTLAGLDVNLLDHEGRSAADYLSERSALVESEVSLHDEFDKFLKSLPAQELGYVESRHTPLLGLADNASPTTSTDNLDRCQPPGAYPAALG